MNAAANEGASQYVRQLLEDVRLAARYASRAGLIGDEKILDPISRADNDFNSGALPEVGPLARLLSRLVNRIRPVTLADLKGGRDPFEEKNQGKLPLLRIILTVFALVVLSNIGFFLYALQKEQEVLSGLGNLQDTKLVVLLSDMRRLAQSEMPHANDESSRLLTEKYAQKREEYLRLGRQLNNFHADTLKAAVIPLFPSILLAQDDASALQISGFAGGGIATSGSSTGGHSGGAAASHNADAEATAVEADACVESNGELVLPLAMRQYPTWMKKALLEALTDYCFQTAVGTAGGSPLLTDLEDNLTFYSGPIRNKVALRIVWCLPIMFGMLGAAIFVMQNIADVRTPAMGWFGMAMRITMGGIGGVAIGWFGIGDVIKLSSSSAIPMSFIAAFLVGYCIEILFRVLATVSNAAIEGISKHEPEYVGADGPAKKPAD